MAITYDINDNLTTLTADNGLGDSWDNAYTFQDILNAIPTVINKQGDNEFLLTTRLFFANGVYFKSTNESIEIKTTPNNPVYIIKSDFNSHIMLGEYNEEHKYSYNGSFLKIYTKSITGNQLNGNRIGGEFLVYGSKIITDANYFTKGIQLLDNATIRYYDSTFRYPGYFWAKNTDVRNVTWIGGGGPYDMLLARGYDYQWTGLKTAGGVNGIFFSSTTNGDVDLFNYNFLYNTTGIDIFNSGTNNFLVRIIDGTPSLPTCSSIGDGKPGVQICNTFNIKVTDKDGNPLEAIKVTLTNIEGNIVINTYTNYEGKLDEDYIVYNYWYRHSNQGGNKNFRKHTLKLDNGIDTVEYNIDIDKQFNGDTILFPQDLGKVNDIFDIVQNIDSKTENIETLSQKILKYVKLIFSI